MPGISRSPQQFGNKAPGLRRAYLRRSLVFVVLMVAFGGACRKSNTAENSPLSQSGASVDKDFWLSKAPVITGHAVKLSDLSESEIHFGIAPKRGPGVTYQDGIVLMEHGDQAIRSFASDGMSWTFDANAPGAKCRPIPILSPTS